MSSTSGAARAKGQRAHAMGRLLGLAATLVTACAPSPVEWSEPRALEARDAASWRLTAEGTLVPDSAPSLEVPARLPDRAMCPSSLRLARARDVVHAVWWSVRPDGGARLLASHSRDGGGSWSAPVPVDTTDRGATGCGGEPPSIAADGRTGYVHVAYALLAPEGPGLFFAHSMDGGAMFHAPVPVLYGERLGATSVASDGDVVAVAFEDPGSTMPRVGLALSRTMGHIFEERLLPVSTEHGAAARPRVAVAGRRIAVAWERRADDAATPSLVVRTGIIR